MKQLWKKFDKLTEICYMSELEDNCPQWDEAYEVFKQLVAQGREKDPQYAAEILKMDDATDFAYGVADWIEDYRKWYLYAGYWDFPDHRSNDRMPILCSCYNHIYK